MVKLMSTTSDYSSVVASVAVHRRGRVKLKDV